MKRNPAHSFPRSSESGVTLVEALVALVVLSIGMLGIAALYVETMKANRNALTRMQAVGLVNDMADRIRANPRGRTAYVLTATGTPAKRNCVATANCTADNLAEDDLAWWVQTVNTTLPSVQTRTVSVDTLAGGMNRFSIRVTWLEPGETAQLRYENVFEQLAVVVE